MKIWTRNVLTGIPDEHDACEVSGSVATYEEGGVRWTLYGGFYTSQKAAKKESRRAALEILKGHDDYAANLKAASGLGLKKRREKEQGK
jgi:hypothetical protein